MLGFITGVCKPEGHWLSLEPVDSKSFPRGERREEIAKWLLGFLLFVFSFPFSGGMWGTVAPEVSEVLLGVQSQGLVQLAERLPGQVPLGEASWR